MIYRIVLSLPILYTNYIFCADHPTNPIDLSYIPVIKAIKFKSGSVEEFINPDLHSLNTESNENKEIYPPEPGLDSYFQEKDPNDLNICDFVQVISDRQTELPTSGNLVPPASPPKSPQLRNGFSQTYSIKLTSKAQTPTILNDPNHLCIWNEICKAIKKSIVNQCCTPEHLAKVANVVYLIHGEQKSNVESYTTLLEYIMQQAPSNERLELLARLCAANIAFFKSGYELELYRHNEHTSLDDPIGKLYHDPPIATAIRSDNLAAFEKLLPMSHNVTIEKKLSLQQFIDKIQDERYKQGQNPKNIDQMKAILALKPSSSCLIQ